jgi:hypothetical protein
MTPVCAIPPGIGDGHGDRAWSGVVGGRPHWRHDRRRMRAHAIQTGTVAVHEASAKARVVRESVRSRTSC